MVAAEGVEGAGRESGTVSVEGGERGLGPGLVRSWTGGMEGYGRLAKEEDGECVAVRAVGSARG